MLSVLLTTEACYVIKENLKNNFAEASYHFANINYHFAGKNRGKPVLCWHFFASKKHRFAKSN